MATGTYGEVGSDSQVGGSIQADNYDYGGQTPNTYAYRLGKSTHGHRSKRGIWTRRRNYGRDQEQDTGSESTLHNIANSDFVDAMYSENTGHGVSTGTVWNPFYGTNQARNNGADIEPVPVTPVRGQNWPEMQVQLRNGWGSLSFGRKLSYDSYLRLLTDSASKNRHYLIPNPAGIGPSAANPGPAPSNVTKLIANSSGAQPSAPGGPGHLINANVLNGRRYYG